jgi:hypothetical protein
MSDVRIDAVSFLGTLPEDPDFVPLAPPSGFIWMTGGSWSGSHESYGIADVRVSHDGEVIDFAMTLADAIALRGLLDQTIEAMRECGDDEIERGKQVRKLQREEGK